MDSINGLLKKLCLLNGNLNFRLRLRFHRSKVLAPAPAILHCLWSGLRFHRPVSNYLDEFAKKSDFLQNLKKLTPGRWRQACTHREKFSNTEALSLLISLLFAVIAHPHSTTVANICRACQMRKGYDNPDRVSF